MMDPSHVPVLTPRATAMLDAEAIDGGIDAFGLMQRAGQVVAATVLAGHPGIRRAVVLCGPGRNGGDGFVAATALAEVGVPVALHLWRGFDGRAGSDTPSRGDASVETARRGCPVRPRALCDYAVEPGDVVIDAVFGGGSDRALPHDLALLAASLAEQRIPVVAVDMPSGVVGRSGAVRGAAFQAWRTVTFTTMKPGHLLYPGRDRCGVVEVVDIGIPKRLVRAAGEHAAMRNGPALWRQALAGQRHDSHKYERGHLVVFSGGPSSTGAARLALAAGQRMGVGLATLACPGSAMAVNAAHLTAAMLKRIDNPDDLDAWRTDTRLSGFVIGPGFGIDRPGQEERLQRFIPALVDRPAVLDADGLSVFASAPKALFEAIAGRGWVLTPHAGEFARLFPDLARDDALSKIDKARKAAGRAGSVIVLKGADTVIAAPDERAAINDNAPFWLATAGAGDVLAGMIGALMAQGTSAFEAACAGVWLHGDAASRLGPGMTAQDLALQVSIWEGRAAGGD